MTIVVAVVTTDGLVLASDSATTQQLSVSGGPPQTSSIWNSANKIVNLRKHWPVGAMTFGRATIEQQSIATHCKDLRAILEGTVADKTISVLDESSFEIKDAAQAVHDYFRVLYDRDPGDVLGFLVGGFSASNPFPEMWQVLIGENGQGSVDCVLPAGQAGIFHQGMTDAITRLVDGAGQGLGDALAKGGVDKAQAEPVADAIRNELSVPWAWSGMPLGETIDLARFLVDTTINFVRFTPGDASVGGPIEIAALTRHEGFRWVQRKHYFDTRLNPREEVN